MNHMSLSHTIREQLKQAMRDKNQAALDTLRAVLAGFTTELVASGKTPQDDIDDAQALVVIKRLMKQRRDALSQFETAGREDLAAIEKEQLVILEQFQPAQMSAEEITRIATEQKAALGITDKTKAGVLMGAVLKITNGAAESSTVKQVIDTLF